MTTECEVVEFQRKRSACPETVEGKNFLQENDEILPDYIGTESGLRMRGLCMCHPDPDIIGGRIYDWKRRDSSGLRPSEWHGGKQGILSLCLTQSLSKGKDPFARKGEILRRPDRVGTPQDDSVVTMSSWAKRRISFRERRDSLSRLHQDSEWQNGALKWKYGKAFISRIWNCRLSWKGLL